MSTLILEDSTVPVCLHPGSAVQGDLNLGECSRGHRMCGFHDCDCPVLDLEYYLSN